MGMNGDQFYENMPMQLRSLKAEDIVLPSEGRSVAKMINAYYYETNILDRSGVDDTFTSALRASVYSRRRNSSSNFSFSFWINPNAPRIPLDSVLPSIQTPLLPEKPYVDLHKYYVKSTYGNDIQKLLEDETSQQFFDCSLTVKLEDGELFDIKAHRIVLSSASSYFREIFSQKKYIRNDFVADVIVLDQHEDQISFRIILLCCKVFAIKLIQFIYSGHLKLDFGDCEEFVSMVKCLDICSTANNSTFLEIDDENFRSNLILRGLNDSTCESSLDIIGENEERFRVYKPILMARCEAINVMMKNEFLEKKENQINLLDISATVLKMFLSYCFTDQIDRLIDVSELEIDHFSEALELASRFCLASFAQLIQTTLINRLTSLPDQECCVIIASQIIGLAKLFNFDCILHWCLTYLCCHKKDVWIDMLDEDTAHFIDIHCWPPEWYFDELRIYDLEMANLEKHLEKRRTKAFLRQNRDQCCLNVGHFLFNFVRFGK
uniref:BTB domain-containing protein n=1 Tax=Romanomermis culicivorax TaxID=13658 RepID=A0A915KHD9_ROMCU